MRAQSIASIFILCFSYCLTQGQNLIQNVQGREQVQTLDGAWKYIVDPYESGYYGHQGDVKTSGYFENYEPENPYELVEYNFSKSGSLQVPGDWNSQVQELYYYEGTVWYQKGFEISSQQGERYFLYFEAVNYQCVVFVNGKRVGRHEGGFTPFNFEITDHIKASTNDVVLMVDNKRYRDGVPAYLTDWFNYGGITRSVHLITTRKTLVENYHIQLDPKKDGLISGWINLTGPDKTIQGTLEIPELKVRQKLAFQNGTASVNLKASPIRWSPDNPKLYDVNITLANDEIVKDRIGFRTIAVQGTEILLNGKPVFLKGVCIHEEVPGGGRANSETHAKQLLQTVKELGGNFVRLAHYPHNEPMIRLADEWGIMVWSEIPVYWGIAWEKPYVLDKAKAQLTAMIERDRNRASVILWSMANETKPVPNRNIFLKSLISTTRSLDPTRLVTAATETHLDPNDPSVFWLDDPINEELDVMSNNIYCGWYYENEDGGCPGLDIKSKFEKPLIMSEFGAGAKAGMQGGERERWTEEFQERVYDETFKMLDKIPFLSGTCPWLLYDFKSPRRVLPGIQDGYNRKGLVSEEGMKKKAFQVVKEYYETKK